MAFNIERKKSHYFQKGQLVWVKTPTTKEAVVIENASPRSVIIQTKEGIQRRNRSQLCRRSENQKSSPPATLKVTSTLQKQKLETRDAESSEESTEERATSTLHQPSPNIQRNLLPDQPDDFTDSAIGQWQRRDRTRERERERHLTILFFKDKELRLKQKPIFPMCPW